MQEVTLVVTSCNRHDLLRRTLQSFDKFNTYPVKEKIVIEDSAAPRPDWLPADIKWISNGTRKGQIYSIDRAYSEVKTDYIFHCEDDWEFLCEGFIESSLQILEKNTDIWTVSLRASDCNGHPVVKAEKFPFNILQPGWHEGWGGTTFNPGLRRLSDYKKIGGYGRYAGYNTHGFGSELRMSVMHLNMGYRIASLPKMYVTHIGAGRSRAIETFKTPKVLIAIPTCKTLSYGAHESDIHKSGENARVAAVRKTWAQFLSPFANVTLKFFYGRGTTASHTDEVVLDVADDYTLLPEKVRAIYKYALDHGFDYVFKADDDTYIYVDRLMASDFEKNDYTGYCADRAPDKHLYASGGPGYWISRKAMELVVAETPTHWAEDLWVGSVLFKGGVHVKRDARYLPGFGDHYVDLAALPKEHSYITLHSCTPEMMQALFEESPAPKFDTVSTALYENAGRQRYQPVVRPLKYQKDGLTADWWDNH